MKDKVLATPDRVRYLVYDRAYEAPSETRELPEDDLDLGPGEWVVKDADGQVVDRFADFDDRA